MKHLSLFTVGAALLTLETVGAAPASAITFTLKGELKSIIEEDPGLGAFEGSYMISDEVIEELLQQPLDPNDPSSFDPNARRLSDVVSSISLTGELINREATPPSDSSITTYLADEDDPFPFGTPVLAVNVLQNLVSADPPIFDVFSFDLEVSGEPNLEQCLVGECVGFAHYAYPEIPGYKGTISQVPTDAESVPEPAGAIALGVVGTTMLLQKRKTLGTRHV